MAFLALFTLLATFLPATLALRGDMTFYTDLSNTDLSKGHCSFSTYQIPAGLYGMAIPSGLYDGSSNCGACAMVHYGGHDIMAMVCTSPDLKGDLVIEDAAPLVPAEICPPGLLPLHIQKSKELDRGEPSLAFSTSSPFASP